MSDRSAASDARLAGRLRLARAALMWERIWPECWLALAVLAVFFVLALFDLLPDLPSRWHAAILLGLGAALLIAARQAIDGFVAPGLGAARRRIERASGLRHRPLEALADRPGTPLDPAATRLWEAHRRRMQAAARSLRIGLPAAGLAARDPFGLRSVLAILLILGAVDAGGDWRERLLRAVAPLLDDGAPAVAANLDIWVTPPEYTGLPPQFLRPGAAKTIRIPTGSVLLAQVHGGDGPPQLTIDGRARDFEAVDKENFQLSQKLTGGKRLEVDQAGAALGSWPIEIIPDDPPTIAFARPPTPTAQGALRIEYEAADDYGVEDVKAVITRAGEKPGAEIVLDLPLPGLHLKRAKATSYEDLTPHPWAGLPVEIRLVATDAAGQHGDSAPVRIVLPERSFHNPVARAIVDQRKEMVKDPAARPAVAEVLGDLREETPRYGDDAVAFLDLRVAQESLRLSGAANSLAQVEQLLWDTALRIENGQAPLALRELRRLEQQLQNALANKAPDQEIDRLMAELSQALDRYLQALAQNSTRPPPPAGDPSRIVTGRDLQHLLEEARQLASAGARQQAQALLSQLRSMLENLRIVGPGQLPQGSNEAQQMMRGMRDLMQRQQQLLDRSFRAEQQGKTDGMGPGAQGGGEQGGGEQPDGVQPGGNARLPDAAREQDALRHALGEMMRRLGEGAGAIPDPLGRAERAMRDATEALRAGQPGAAIGPQTDALDQLQQAAREVARQMQQQLSPGWGGRGDDPAGTAGEEPGGRVRRDPLGRPLPTNGAYDEGDVKIPDWNTLQQSRKILDELRRRAGESYRPTLELDYINRLLQQF
jgi:uncharacterized protein (TIGR02302 family)